ncbi:MAG: T9SS type A sorting domain-containing protein, partial [Candidatus Neomarinimicrobiota bacterium]
VTGVDATTNEYYNLVIWSDVDGEAGEAYNVYASTKPITDVKSLDVDLIAQAVPENTQSAIHRLYYPLKDKEIDMYYAVECLDAAGNVGPAGTAGPITNTAQAMATISLDPPSNFAVDGDLGEWEASGIMPFVLKPSTNKVPEAFQVFDDDNDLTATVYIAIDADNLYFAADVIDDVWSYDAVGDWWQDDIAELYLGFYDARGPKHQVMERGTEPDYKLQILYKQLVSEFNDNQVIYTSDSANYYFEPLGAADWIIETVVPLDSIRFGDDALFTPLNGMRIPIDIYFHDTDATLNTTEGTLALSWDNDDNSWQSPANWTYTWIGDTTEVFVGIASEAPIVMEYSLSQNYPNPFNPSTTIKYSLAKAGDVRIDVYNILGKQVTSLVNEFQPVGHYRIVWNGQHLPSGIYFYRIQAADFTLTKKMILLK